MIIYTNFIHLQDSDRTIPYLSIDVCSIFVGVLVPEKLSSLYEVTSRNHQWEWQQQQLHLVPLISCNSRKIWAISTRLNWTSEKLKALMGQHWANTGLMLKISMKFHLMLTTNASNGPALASQCRNCQHLTRLAYIGPMLVYHLGYSWANQ